MPGIPFPTTPRRHQLGRSINDAKMGKPIGGTMNLLPESLGYKPGYGQPYGGATGYTGAGRLPRMSRDARMTRLGMMDPAERTGRSVDMGLVSMQDAMANTEAARASVNPEQENAFAALPSNRRRRSRRGY